MCVMCVENTTHFCARIVHECECVNDDDDNDGDGAQNARECKLKQFQLCSRLRTASMDAPTRM